MDLTVNQSIRLKITKQFVLVGVSFGVVYIFLLWGFSDLYHYVNGVVAGFILGLLLAGLELTIFSRGAKKLKFIWLLIIRTLVYLVLIIAIIINVVAISRMFMWHTSYLNVLSDVRFYKGYILEGDFPIAVFYTLVFAFSVNFVRMISRKMGQGMLMSYIRGTYFSPVHQARIIMFIALADRKKIFQELGPENQHRFLNELYYDLTVPVVKNRGIIYEYVEDLMVLSWAMDKGLQDASCIRVFFDIRSVLNQNKEKYLSHYGFVPHMRAGVHTGSVVRAEIGEIKTQIAFHGDTMNTTARILGNCGELGKGLMVSDQLIGMIGLPNIYSKELVGEVKLRGKEEAIKLFEIKESIGES